MSKLVQNIRDSVAYPAFIILILWVVHFYLAFNVVDRAQYALLPRQQDGLLGMFVSPFIHANIEHLASNSLPLLVLMTGIIYFYRHISSQTILLLFLFTQFSVWCFARSLGHIGASGIVYSFFGFILGMGFFQRNVKSIVLALLVIAFYGGMIWGVLPGQPGVSWESHLLGFLSGISVAFLYKDDIEPDNDAVMGHQPFAFRHQPYDINKDKHDFFLPRNTFAGLRPKYTPIEQSEEWQYYEQLFKENYQQQPPTDNTSATPQSAPKNPPPNDWFSTSSL